jgi:hypothetical protein
MIVSASRRTDIPAYYSEWFMNRIRDGFVLVRNPFRPTQISRVNLEPGRVDGIVFWTRNGEPLIPYLPELDRIPYCYYVQYTVVHYPRILEPSSVSLPRKLDGFKRLSERIGPNRVVWRYDPIILSNLTDVAYHEGYFKEIATALSGFTRRCVISFLDIYRKTRKAVEDAKRKKGIRVVDVHRHDWNARELSRVLAKIGGDYGLEMLTCAEPFDLEDWGIRHGKCIDDALLNRLFGLNLTVTKDKGQRELCGCVESKDIGAYNTCPHGCMYCYANTTVELARRNFKRHESGATWLL